LTKESVLSYLLPIMHPAVRSLFPRALRGEALSLQDAEALTALPPRHLPELLALAGAVNAASGPAPFACGIINAKSGLCGENCRFCAQAGSHTGKISVYPLVSLEKLLRQAEVFAAAGLRFMGIVTAGGAPTTADFERICGAAGHIASRVDIGLCASIGRLSLDQARELRRAGFTSCHHNLESSPGFYPSLCTTQNHENRVRTAENIKAAGLRTCCGGIFGVGENWRQRLELAALLRELDVDSIPINFLTPMPGTPLEKRRRLPAWEALAVIALMRLMHPGRDIICCGGRTRTLRRVEALLLVAGANGLMTGDYLVTRGSSFRRDKALFAALGIRDVIR
jgi:biotin synthase